MSTMTATIDQPVAQQRIPAVEVRGCTGPDGEIQGTYRWLKMPTRKSESGVLRINGQLYDVVPILVVRMVVGYKVGTLTVRTIGQADGRFRCDCKDFIYRRQLSRKGCKHCAALRAALVQAKILPATDK